MGVRVNKARVEYLFREDAENLLVHVDQGHALQPGLSDDFYPQLRICIPHISDVDPDPVGSAFIWVSGSGFGSRGITLSEMQSLTNKLFFCRKLYFSILKLKKFRNKFDNIFFFSTFKRWVEINLVI